ncbi:MAG: MFS transporter [Hyphomicrobiaceae bacterium]
MVGEVSARGPAPFWGQQTRTLAGVSLAHWVSHVHLLTLPPLFPILKDLFNVGYVELGLSVTIFGIISGLTQAPMGFIVDRFGAKRILLAGLCLGGCAFIMLGLNPTYELFLIAAAIAGLANCVYHPADYAILSSALDDRRMGRAFSIHTCAGMAGGAMAPAIGLWIALQFGVGWALIVIGTFGPLVAIGLLLLRVPDSGGAPGAVEGAGGRSTSKRRSVLSPAILALMLFFVLLSLSGGGMSAFGVAALQSGYQVSLETASLTLSFYLGAMAIGVLAGGLLADKTTRHGYIAAVCFAANALLFLVVAVVPLPSLVLICTLTLAGFMSGLIAPSRDMLVRRAAPPGASGRAFGIVSTGFNIGSIFGPMLFGFIMDQGAPSWLFGVSAFFMLLTVLLATWTERPEQRQPARS